jgi:type I restriction enzyme M protein
MRGILPDNIVVRNGDTLEEDWPWFDDQDPHNSYEPLYCDAVVSNPPYSQEWTPKEESKTDPRYKNYGVAPKSTADYAFLLHDLYHVKPGGIMTIVLPHGVLFRGGEEGNIRKNLVENNNIDAIIGLPANIFFGTGIPTIVMVLKQKRDCDDILIVDASKGFEKVGKNNQLRARDIRKIVDAVTERREIPKFSKLITRQDVRDNDYNLNIPRYVNSADSDEQWDINAIMFGGIPNSEIDTFKDVWNTFPTLREQIFAPVSDKYSRLRQADVDEVVMQNGDFNSFISRYNAALIDMPYQLRKELFEEYQTVNVGKKIREITTNLFSRVKPFEPIIDSYAAYQLLEDQWNLISNDLEILQTEGIEAARVCDPKMEIKKKDGKDVEVQVGWQGRVMPFEIVQEYLLPEMLEEYQAKKDELENTRERIQEILSEAQELDPQPNYLKEDGSAFVPKEVKAECKRIKARIKAKESDPESLDEQILEVDSLIEKEKVQKKDIAAFYDELIAATMDKIANLSDDEIVEVLHRKHLVPLFNAIAELPMQQESQLVAAIYALNSKYGETLVDIDKTISESEKSLATLVDNLTGSDADMAGLREFQKLLRHE